MRQEPTKAMCSRECGANCCRSPLVIQVTGEELAAMQAIRPDVKMRSAKTDVSIDMATGEQTSRTVITFSEEPGERCPFLQGSSNLCTVYDARPETCRGFPDRPESWCLAWLPDPVVLACP